ncbi:MAG: hypothetical protein COB37_04535 [Kordiimonadales bacterium]|nr:MAG: hypothetical protein COB37_04535 [Kordiimonadales bacterium]
MDFDDLPRKLTGPIVDVEKEDLSPISMEHLVERVARLQAEITRTQSEMKAKEASKNAAEAFFKS